MNTITNIITYFNFFGFFKLSVDFEFKELENAICTFIDQHNIKFPKQEFLNKEDLLQFYDTFALDMRPNYSTKVLNIPANVLSILLSLPYTKMNSISVDSNNCGFTSINGILYSKNLDRIVCFPAKHKFSSYCIPRSVTSIGNSSFSVIDYNQSQFHQVLH